MNEYIENLRGKNIALKAIDSAIENEVHDNLESPIWGCDFSVQEM